jgi:raffinose/stachyose/melibiose transport system permease protein
VLATIAAVVSLSPFVFMVLGSVKTRGDFLRHPFGLPREFTFDNFTGLFSSNFGRYFVNSIVITAVTVTGTVVLAILAAYPLSRFRTRLNTPMMLLFLAGIMVPVHVTLIPIYVLTQQIRMYDSIGALFGPYIAFNLPIAIFATGRSCVMWWCPSPGRRSRRWRLSPLFSCGTSSLSRSCCFPQSTTIRCRSASMLSMASSA